MFFLQLRSHLGERVIYCDITKWKSVGAIATEMTCWWLLFDRKVTAIQGMSVDNGLVMRWHSSFNWYPCEKLAHKYYYIISITIYIISRLRLQAAEKGLLQVSGKKSNIISYQLVLCCERLRQLICSHKTLSYLSVYESILRPYCMQILRIVTFMFPAVPVEIALALWTGMSDIWNYHLWTTVCIANQVEIWFACP